MCENIKYVAQVLRGKCKRASTTYKKYMYVEYSVVFSFYHLLNFVLGGGRPLYILRDLYNDPVALYGLISL